MADELIEGMGISPLLIAPGLSVVAIHNRQHLGQGGGGGVFRARAELSNGTDLNVAVKQVMISAGRDAAEPTDVANFERELAILQNLTHPNIVKFYGGWRFPNRTSDGLIVYPDQPNAIVMELVSQGSLNDLIYSPELLAPNCRIIILQDIAAGLHYLHDVMRIEHRDIKPDNVLVKMIDGLPQAVITDFGLTVRRKTITGPSFSGDIRGTEKYMPPEIYRSFVEEDIYPIYSRYMDIYAFAIVMWEMVMRNVPFSNMNFLRLAQHVAGGNRLPLPTEEQCSQAYTELMQACWRQDHQQRPAAVEIVDHLAAMAENNDPRLSDRLIQAITAHEEGDEQAGIWYLIKRDPRLLTQVLASGRTAFHLACEVGTIEIVERLVETLDDRFADILGMAIEDWQPTVLNRALLEAVTLGATDRVLQLLTWGAQVSDVTAQVQDAQQRINELEQQAIASETERTALAARLAEQLAVINNITAERDNARNELITLEGHLVEQRNEVTRLTEEIRISRVETERLQAQLENHETSEQRAQQRIIELEQQLATQNVPVAPESLASAGASDVVRIESDSYQFGNLFPVSADIQALIENWSVYFTFTPDCGLEPNYRYLELGQDITRLLNEIHFDFYGRNIIEELKQIISQNPDAIVAVEVRGEQVEDLLATEAIVLNFPVHADSFVNYLLQCIRSAFLQSPQPEPYVIEVEQAEVRSDLTETEPESSGVSRAGFFSGISHVALQDLLIAALGVSADEVHTGFVVEQALVGLSGVTTDQALQADLVQFRRLDDRSTRFTLHFASEAEWQSCRAFYEAEFPGCLVNTEARDEADSYVLDFNTRYFAEQLVPALGRFHEAQTDEGVAETERVHASP